MDLEKQYDAELEGLSENIFSNIQRHLRENRALKVILEYIKSLKKYPGIGSVITLYTDLIYN
jgi:hypothetical protein